MQDSVGGPAETARIERQVAASGAQVQAMGNGLANALPGYEDTINLKVEVRPQGQALRPMLVLEPTDHLLAKDQQSGVGVEGAMKYLHDWGGF